METRHRRIHLIRRSISDTGATCRPHRVWIGFGSGLDRVWIVSDLFGGLPFEVELLFFI